jgi:hypothetical protein
MRFELWHRDVPNFRDNNPRELQLDFPKGFTKVAVIDAPHVEAVFGLSNHVTRSWTENSEVIELPKGNHVRSTSVGDVVIAVETLDAWSIDSIGLTQFEGDATRLPKKGAK